MKIYKSFNLSFKRLLVFVVLILFNHSAFSQSLNEDFLQSLPQSVKDEIQSQSVDENSLDENYNKKPDTRIKTLEEAIASVKKELSSIEVELSKNIIKENIDNLEIFGSNFFDSYQSSFAPVDMPRLISGYILDVGDVLRIQLVGKLNDRLQTPILPDGSVVIKKVGQVSVSGLPIEEAINKIKDYVGERILGTEVNVSLEIIRNMNVLLIENTSNPGMYTLPGNTDILSLLHAAGGIDENGSFRKITHKRNNKILQEIDLYKTLIDGDIHFDHQLRNGDVVIVNQAKRHVSISGGVSVPAIYELKEGENFSHLLGFAKGKVNKFSGDVFSLIKNNGESRDYSFSDDIEKINLEPGDNVFVPLYKPFNTEVFTVSIDGAVNKPGKYSFEPGEKLSDIIVKAGGYKESAYPYAGSLYRKKVGEIQKEMFERTYTDIITHISTSANVGLGLNASNLQIILPQLKNVEPKGRLSAEFNLTKLKENPALDTLIANNDKIHIPYFSSEVFVFGEVQNPGAVNHNPEITYKNYIEQAGGFNKFADKKRSIVILPNGEAFVAGDIGFFANKESIYPGSIVYVPREIGRLDGINFATATLAPIVSSLALSLASLNSIND